MKDGHYHVRYMVNTEFTFGHLHQAMKKMNTVQYM